MKRFSPLLLVVGLLAATSAWSSDPDAPPVVQYRHTVMEGLGKHMKATSMIVKGEVDRKGDLVAHAQALHDVSLFLVELFPEGTGPDKMPSDSKPEVWTDRKGFVKANDVFIAETRKLLEIAKKDDFDAFKAQFGKVGKSCGGCHDGYRVKED